MSRAADPVADALLPTGPVSSLPPGTPAVQRHGDEFTIRWGDHGVEVKVAGLREHSDGVSAEVAMALAGEEIHWAKVNLASTASREALVKKLAAVAPRVPWRPIVERACRLCVDASRAGNPTALIVPRLRVGPRHLVEPIMPISETAVIAGDGGACKSYLALALALAVSSGAPLPKGLRAEVRGPVLLLDWEGTEDETAERALLLANGLGCHVDGLHYKPMVAPLSAEIAAVRAEVSRLGAVAVIIDSLAPASGPEPEGADAAVRTMTALRSLAPASRLVVAHVSKAVADGHGPARPFGSVFIQNLARSVWEARRSSDDDGDDLLVGLYHTKVNSGRRHHPIALRLHFGPDAVRLHAADLADSPDLVARAGLSTRILAALAHGTATVEALATQLGAKPDVVRATLHKLKGKKLVAQLPDTKPAAWGLAAR